MIGVGIDIVQISAFSLQLDDASSVFKSQTFTANELAYADSNVSKRPSQHLSVRFAAKEAFIKAWASLHRFQPPKVLQPKFNEIEICNDRYGRPYIVLHGLLRELCTAKNIQLSLSHEGDYAIAQVYLEDSSR